MRIEDIRVSETSEGIELGGREGSFRLWFRFSSGFNIVPNGDPFLAAFLLTAMLRGEDLEIDPAAPVSEQLLNATQDLQKIFHCWNPAFRKIRVTCRTAAKRVLNDGVASFYSRGVDSNYTFLANRERITHLISMRGFDFVVEDGWFADPLLDTMAAFAKEQGKGHVRVASNIRKLYYPNTRLGWNCSVGSALAAVGLALGFPLTLIASGHTYSELTPTGTHALTDPMWSTEATRFVYDAAEVSRSQKVRAIAADPGILSNLWVCWEQPGTNCGRCSKCVRTRIALHLLGIRSPAFPGELVPEQVRKLSVTNSGDLLYFFDNMNLAKEAGNRAMQKALAHCIRKFELGRLAWELDAQLVGGSFRRLYGYAMRKTGRTDPDRHASRVDFLRR